MVMMRILIFNVVEKTLYNLIERGQDGLEELIEIFKQSEHPRRT